MGEVVLFPGKLQSNDAELRQAMHSALMAKGATASAAATVCDAVMPLIQESRKVIARGVSFGAVASLSEDQVSAISASASQALQEYQQEVGENAMKLACLLAVEMAKSAK